MLVEFFSEYVDQRKELNYSAYRFQAK